VNKPVTIMKHHATLAFAAFLLASCSEKKQDQAATTHDEAANTYDLQRPAPESHKLLTTEIPPELIEGTPNPPRLPGLGAPVHMGAAPKLPHASLSQRIQPQACYGASAGFSSAPAWSPPPTSSERYGALIDNAWLSPNQQPLSTFSIDIDTASYSNLRRMIEHGAKIPRDAVRLEEMVNYFDYHYPQPQGDQPFAVHVHNAVCPWNAERQLVRIALKGKEVPRLERPAANLIFLLDVSGSMNSADKLPLVLASMRTLADQLNADDSLAIVVYAGAEGVALPATKCDPMGRDRIAGVLQNLRPGGSTNGEAGLHLAYRLARENFKPGGINRVILATDGDFNVGVTGNQSLVELVAENAKSQVDLTVIGVGTGNLNDSMLEAITNHGNGAYHYVDSIAEGRRVFLDKMMGTLVTIAKDVKIQVEFNPAQVKQYRLLGYANRMLRKEDFANDRVDAGDIGSGHTVTAFYEVETVGRAGQPEDRQLRYSRQGAIKPEPKPDASGEWLNVKLRYKTPGAEHSVLFEKPYTGIGRELQAVDADFQFAASVTMLAMWLRGDESAERCHPERIAEQAERALGQDADGKRAEFVGLVKRLQQNSPALRYGN